MAEEGEQAPVALNDGMGGSERKRVIEMPEMASLYIECLGPMGQVVSRATGFVVRNEKAVPYLVTNRHVVTGRSRHPGLGWKVDVIALPIHVDDAVLDPPPVPMTPFPAQLRTATKVLVVGFPMGFDPFT